MKLTKGIISCQSQKLFVAGYDKDVTIVVEDGHENSEIEEIVKSRRLEHSGTV
jgi:hypothetical protein